MRFQATLLTDPVLRTLSGITFQITGASLTPLTVDGGFVIAGTASDSVGILYPGERVDLILHWTRVTQLNVT